MIARPGYLTSIQKALSRSPITALLGPRQCGKTTLAREVAREKHSQGHECHFFDLENPIDRARLDNPLWALEQLHGLIIIDEIQLSPALFPLLRVLADVPDNPRSFLLLGSASPTLMRQASESLAGRIEFIELTPFCLSEVGNEQGTELWHRGGYPRSFLSTTDSDSSAWREGFIRTFLERDIPQLGISIAPVALRRFWTMLAHYHGQLWNSSELARSLGISDKTVRSYLDILTGTYMIRQLQPWHENISKRQVKSPKIYFRDSGVLHHLMGISSLEALHAHPKLGASWEGFALETFLGHCRPDEAYFWSTYTGAELDLFYLKDGKRHGLEIKFSQTPRFTKSMQMAQSTLSLDQLMVLIPGRQGWPLADGVDVIGLENLPPL